MNAAVNGMDSWRNMGEVGEVLPIRFQSSKKRLLSFVWWRTTEHLCRAQLSPADRAAQTARRKAIYLELHPETAAGKAGAEARWNASVNLSFASATAEATGKTERTTQRDAERGEKVSEEALNLVRLTALDTGSYLDKLKRDDERANEFAVRMAFR